MTESSYVTPFPTPTELRAQLVQVEQHIRFLADANSLGRRLDCLDENGRYAGPLDLVFRLVDTLATVAEEQLRSIGGSLTDDLPF